VAFPFPNVERFQCLKISDHSWILPCLKVSGLATDICYTDVIWAFWVWAFRHFHEHYSAQNISTKNIYSWKMIRKLKWQIPGEPLAARYNWRQDPVPGHGPEVEKHCLKQQAQLTSKFNKIFSKKDFRKEKEILTCLVERHKSRQKKKISLLNLKLCFKPTSAQSAGEIEVWGRGEEIIVFQWLVWHKKYENKWPRMLLFSAAKSDFWWESDVC
jgi:hypothetical protein